MNGESGISFKELFSKDIDRNINGVIKANDEKNLNDEVNEYVLTEEICRNLAKFLDLCNREDISFDPSAINAGATGTPYKGSFEDMLLRIQSTLAEDQKTTTSLLTNYTVTQNEIYTDRDSVSGVDLNDEATNLMVYQKAYTAACRLMTVLEEALDSLINGMVV